MGLNVSKGNMYSFINFTYNTIKGKCYHDCSYCYCKRWGKQKPVRFDEKELKTDLGEGNFIFVGSSNDMFAENIPNDWILNTLTKCNWYDNKYLFQTKNPAKFDSYIADINRPFYICTTIETNRFYPEHMGNSPKPKERALGMEILKTDKKYVTIEPIMDFDLKPMIELIKRCEPIQVNIGADSGGNNLPEPSWEKIMQLKEELSKFTVIAKKKNLGRLEK